MRSIRSFFPFWGCSSPRFDNTSWPLYWFHDGLNYISWLLSEHSMMVSLRTVPSIFSVFDTSIRRVDYALWAARWFHDSDKSYFARSLPISSLLFLRNWTNRATLKKLNLMTSEPRERIFEPRKRRIETHFPRVVWLLDMNQPTVEPRFLGGQFMKLLLGSHLATTNFKMLLIVHVGGSIHQTSIASSTGRKHQ